jgi:hypothetical protein
LFFFSKIIDGTNLAVGLQNGNVCIFDVLGNGDFHLRPDGILQVIIKNILENTYI